MNTLTKLVAEAEDPREVLFVFRDWLALKDEDDLAQDIHEQAFLPAAFEPFAAVEDAYDEGVAAMQDELDDAESTIADLDDEIYNLERKIDQYADEIQTLTDDLEEPDHANAA